MDRLHQVPTHLNNSLLCHMLLSIITHPALLSLLAISPFPPLPHLHHRPCSTPSSIPTPPITHPPPHSHHLPTITLHNPPHCHSSLQPTQPPPDSPTQVSPTQYPTQYPTLPHLPPPPPHTALTYPHQEHTPFSTVSTPGGGSTTPVANQKYGFGQFSCVLCCSSDHRTEQCPDRNQLFLQSRNHIL